MIIVVKKCALFALLFLFTFAYYSCTNKEKNTPGNDIDFKNEIEIETIESDTEEFFTIESNYKSRDLFEFFSDINNHFYEYYGGLTINYYSQKSYNAQNETINITYNVEDGDQPQRLVTIYKHSNKYHLADFIGKNINAVLNNFDNKYYTGQLNYTYEDKNEYTYFFETPKHADTSGFLEFITVDSIITVITYRVIGNSMLGQSINYSSEDDFIIETSEKGLVVLAKYVGTNKNVNIPPRIQNLNISIIGNEAFMDSGLVNVTIPDGIIHIGEGAFASNSLESITIPETVQSIGKRAFADNQIVSANIFDGLLRIEEKAFYNNHIYRITIPDTVIEIGESAFESNIITRLTIRENISILGKSAFRMNKIALLYIDNGSLLTIPPLAFANNELTKIIVPNNIKNIHESAFSGNNIRFINIESEKINMEPSAFENKFDDFYNGNANKPGIYTYNNGKWDLVFLETPVQDYNFNGDYIVTSGYSLLYNAFGQAREIITTGMGMKSSINNNKMMFLGEEYSVLEGNGYKRENDYLLSYENFIFMFAGLNYGIFNEDVIGKNYTGQVKALTLKNDSNNYSAFYANNKLIIEIEDRNKESTEFKDKLTKSYDSYFYVFEKTRTPIPQF